MQREKRGQVVQVTKQTHLLLRTNRLLISTKKQAGRLAAQPTGSIELIDLYNKTGWAGARAVRHEAQLSRANNRSRWGGRRSHHIWGRARRSRLGLMRARFVYSAPGWVRLARACKFLLILRARPPTMAALLAQPAAAGIVNRCRSLLIPRLRARSDREPAVPTGNLSVRSGHSGRPRACITEPSGTRAGGKIKSHDCRRRRPPR
jgi:hypothetical protein